MTTDMQTDADDTEAGYRAFHDGAALVERPAAGVVTAAGPDARSFLDALVSQSLQGLDPGHGAPSLLLQPTGKMGIAFRLLVVEAGGEEGERGEEFWLVTDDGYGTPLAEMLRRYLLRVKCELTDRSEGWGAIALRGPRAVAVAGAALGVDVPSGQDAHVGYGAARVVRADWPGGLGVEVIGPWDDVTRAHAALLDAGAHPVTSDVAEAVRIEAGELRQATELGETVIPQEAFVELDAVSFDKGCFLGQELVCRIRDRGRVNRHLRRLALAGDAVPPVGAEVGDGERSVGALTSVAALPGSGRVVALGYLRREIEPGSTVAVRWDGGESAADVLDPPPGG